MRSKVPGQALHNFDCLLCRHIRDNICWHLDHEVITQRVGKLDSRLSDYLCQGHPDLADVPAVGAYLLSAKELEELIDVVAGLPAFTIREPPKAPGRVWLTCAEFFENTPLCTGEIRSALGPSEAERWAKHCNALVARLTSRNLSLDHGIETAGKLTHLIRQYLMAMGKLKLVPPPLGTFATPTNPTPVPQSAEEALDEKIRDAVYRMREAIRKHDRGSHATPAALIKLAKINKQTGRKALRELEKLGEYHGHGRSKADRSKPQ